MTEQLEVCDDLARLAADHARFKALMEEHQIALVEARLHDARLLFDQLRAELDVHMCEEEASVIPAYEAARRTVGGVSGGLFRSEHRLIRELFAAVADRLDRTDASGRPAAQLIALIEEERRLKHVLEHHASREEAVLFLAVARYRDRTRETHQDVPSASDG